MFNVVSVMGRLTRDPEIKEFGESKVCNFTVACERDYNGKDGEKQTDFIDCVAWRNTAEFISKWFHKGDMIVVTGRIQVRPWEDKEGNKRRTAEIVCEHAYFGGGRNSNGQESAPAAESAPEAAESAFKDIHESDDGDLPF